MNEIENLSKVIELLKQYKGEYVSGEKISSEINVSRVAVWKMIKKLKSYGYNIKSNKNRGYKLVSGTKFLFPEEFKNLNISIIKNFVHYFMTTSTMDIAQKMVEKNPDIENTIVISEQQSKGRGRLNRKWFSPKGGIYFSVILTDCKVSISEVFLLNFVFSLGIIETLRELYNIPAMSKWPNDVVVYDKNLKKYKKLAGILIEVNTEIDKVNWCIVGVGINVNIEEKFFLKHKDFLHPATSIRILLNKPVDRIKFFRELLINLDLWYKKFISKKYSSILQKWRECSATIGRKVKVVTSSSTVVGEAIGVSDEGGLIVKDKSNTLHTIFSGDCFNLTHT